jgi:hypothetical protein
VISKAANDLHQSQLVRRIVISIGNSNQLNKLDSESLTKMRALLEWCSGYANKIDPRSNPEALVRNFYGKESGFLDP